MENYVDNVTLDCRIFERINNALRSNGDRERNNLVAWRNLENEKGDEESQTKIIDKMPKRIKQRRRIVGKNGVCRLILNSLEEFKLNQH